LDIADAEDPKVSKAMKALALGTPLPGAGKRFVRHWRR
jgi:hypothetical protein